MKFKLYIAMMVLFTALSARAGDSTAKVTYVGTYGDGRLFVMLDATINETGCPSGRFDVPTGHPQIKSWLAIALAAAAGGKTVVVHTSGCYGTLPTMTQNSDTWFYIQQN